MDPNKMVRQRQKPIMWTYVEFVVSTNLLFFLFFSFQYKQTITHLIRLIWFRLAVVVAAAAAVTLFITATDIIVCGFTVTFSISSFALTLVIQKTFLLSATTNVFLFILVCMPTHSMIQIIGLCICVFFNEFCESIEISCSRFSFDHQIPPILRIRCRCC